MSRTLQATDEGLSTAFLALKRKHWTKYSVILCDKSFAGRRTLKRFWAGNAISREYFISICKALEVDWQDISMIANDSSRKKWTIHIEINDVDDEISDKIADNICNLLKKYSGDSTLQLSEVKRGSIILLLEGSIEGYERIEYLFQQGQLDDLLGVTVSSVKLKPIALGEWLLGNFVEAISLGWQEPPTGFADATTGRRVKEVYLTDDISVRLILSIEEETEQFFRVVVVVLPDTEIRNVLPLGLRLQVFSQEDEFLGEDVVEAADEPLRIEIGGLEREELFRLALLLDNEEYSEEFIV